ncbi:interferon gamma receptor 2 [Oxyura jamaicensis]|uniref:interferon gamma receptor 2 n=1 Tax=Oxyura jamaicensis TaxID=8884 RepID=UPI0015A5E5AF|nr:interferon gamma receptor 2 [Oxyura jamaicensis]
MPWRALLLSFLLLLLLLGLAQASGEESSPRLPAPKDVKVYSYNYRSALRWSPVKVDRGVVLYTAHFKTGAFNQWDEMNCTRITQTECSFPLSLNERLWTFVFRVRSELGQMTSDWVETNPFVADRDTTIGPPAVNSVIVSSDSLLISVSPPFESQEGTVWYHVSYWENATTTTKKEMQVNNALFKIENLKQMTLYCFTIEIELARNLHDRIPGLQRIPECYRTPMSETTRDAYIITTFTLVGLFLILIIIGLFFLWRHHKTIKYLCQPPLKIPSHIEEYLRDPSMPHLEALENYHEEAPHDSLCVLYFEEGREAYDDTLDGNTRSHSNSGECEVT